MDDKTVTVTLSQPDAEILLGVLSAERHNPDAQAVCDEVRRQLDAGLGGG